MCLICRLTFSIPLILKVPTTKPDYCHRDRCGANAVCKNVYGHIVCECYPGYYGNPYLACHPECVLNTDCDRAKACLNNKCTDPCIGVCGVSAKCQVVNHVPVCYCASDYTGDPLTNCYPHRQCKYKNIRTYIYTHITFLVLYLNTVYAKVDV